MKAAPLSRRDRLRHILADLRMPGALEALDMILQGVDGGTLTAPEAIEQYAIRVVDAWKLGRAEPDDGALLLVAVQDRALRIEVGRGLEGALTDLAANRIIDETITPRFREGDFAGGISAGVDRMIQVIDGEPLPEPEKHWKGPQGVGAILPILFFVIFFASTILRAVFGRALGSLASGGVAGGITWFVTQALGVSMGVGVVGLHEGHTLLVALQSTGWCRAVAGSSSGRCGIATRCGRRTTTSQRPLRRRRS